MAKPSEKPKAADKISGEAYRIVLLGGTGAGKSSLGNSLLGGQHFKAMGGVNSVTKKCSMQWGYMETSNNLQEIMVWDTPGLCDTEHSDEETKTMIAKCLASIAPGAHIILLVASGKDRFSEKEYKVFQDIKELMGEELLKHTIPVFTGADKIAQRGADFEAEIKSNQYTDKMLDQIPNKYFLMDNKATKENNKEKYCDQMTKLLDQFKKVAPEKKYLSNPTQEALSKLVEQAVAEKMKKSPGMEYKEAKRQVVTELIADSPEPPSYFRPMVTVVVNTIDHIQKPKPTPFCKVL